MSTLESLIAKVNKQYGKGTLMPASEATSLVVDRISTGIFDLDMKTGGGIPRGRISMLKGEFSAGKSAVAMKVAACAQRQCRWCGGVFEWTDLFGEIHEEGCKCGKKEAMRVVWLDSEHAYSPQWSEQFGVDSSQILIIQTEYAEQAIDVADLCIRSKECDLLVVDSVAALTPGVEVEQSAEKWQMGVFARLMNKALRKWTSGMNAQGLLSTLKPTILLINQMRVNLGGYHSSMTSPGGKGLAFFESLEVLFKRTALIEEPVSKRAVGIDIEFQIKKNKTAPPSSGGKFALYFVALPPLYKVSDTDTAKQVLRAAVFWGLVKKGGAWFTFSDGSKFQGEENASARIREDTELLISLQKQVSDREMVWAKTGEGVGEILEEDSENET